MRRGTILKNLWTSRETYFIYMGVPVRTGKIEAKAVGGYSLENVNNEWEFKRACYYVNTLKDSEHFPVVGYIDLEETCIRETLKAIGRWNEA